MRLATGGPEIFAGHPELHHADHHGEAGGEETEAEANLLPDRTRHQRGNDRAEVDAHIEDGESCVAAVAGLTLIKLAHDRADVRFQQSDTEHDDEQAEVEELVAAGDGEHAIAERDQDAAVPDCAPLSEDAVGDPAARNAEQVHRAGIDAVDCTGVLLGHAEAAARDGRAQEQRQQRPHAVVGEALEHLREEERRQAAGVAEPLRAVGKGA